MGSGKGIRADTLRRAFRTLFFMVIMVASLLVSSLPLLISVLDVITPCVLLSTFTCCSSCFKLRRDWAAYNFRTSLMDVPLLSLIRSLAIFCVYSVCGIPSLTYGFYVIAACISGAVSAILLVVKACMFTNYDVKALHIMHASAPSLHLKHIKNACGLCLLISCSIAMALAHIMVAYKVKCQAQRKMHLYRLDPEAMNGLLHVRVNEKHRRLLVDEGSPTQKELILKFLANSGKS